VGECKRVGCPSGFFGEGAKGMFRPSKYRYKISEYFMWNSLEKNLDWVYIIFSVIIIIYYD
jgi:hypothetical protein